MFLCILIIYISCFITKLILNKALKPLLLCCCYFPQGSVSCSGHYRLEPPALRAARTQVWSRDLSGPKLLSGPGPAWHSKTSHSFLQGAQGAWSLLLMAAT